MSESTHKKLLKEAREAVARVFEDRSVSRSTILKSLDEIGSDVDGAIDAIRSDMNEDEA